MKNADAPCAGRALVGVPHRPDRLTAVAAFEVLEEVARKEVETPREVRIVRKRRRGPVVAVRARGAEVRDVAEAGDRRRKDSVFKAETGRCT